MKNKVIVFRVDASPFIGSGHVMRCLNLAEMFREQQGKVYFLCRDYPRNLSAEIISRDFEVLLLDFDKKEEYLVQTVSDDYKQWLWVTQDQDALESMDIIKKFEISVDLLILDHYALDSDWEKKCRAITRRILVIDDLANRLHNCDYLLDQNYFSNMADRYLGKVNSDCKLLLGPSYFLFSNSLLYQAKNIRQRTELKRIFVFFGGADSKDFTSKILPLIKDFPLLEFHIVVGAVNPNFLKIKNSIKDKNCKLYYNINYMHELINDCDFGICAGGVNTYERMLLRLPGIVYATAENQLETCNALADNNYIFFCTEFDLDYLRNKLREFSVVDNYQRFILSLNEFPFTNMSVLSEVAL